MEPLVKDTLAPLKTTHRNFYYTCTSKCWAPLYKEQNSLFQNVLYLEAPLYITGDSGVRNSHALYIYKLRVSIILMIRRIILEEKVQKYMKPSYTEFFIASKVLLTIIIVHTINIHYKTKKPLYLIPVIDYITSLKLA